MDRAPRPGPDARTGCRDARPCLPNRRPAPPPFHRSVPDVSRFTPRSVCANVDFPQPHSPTRPTTAGRERQTDAIDRAHAGPGFANRPPPPPYRDQTARHQEIRHRWPPGTPAHGADTRPHVRPRSATIGGSPRHTRSRQSDTADEIGTPAVDRSDEHTARNAAERSGAVGMAGEKQTRVGMHRRGNYLRYRSASTVWPAYITVTVSQSCATTPKSCVTNSMERSHSAARPRSSFRTCSCVVTSRAVVGSSARTSSAEDASAAAISSLDADLRRIDADSDRARAPDPEAARISATR